MPKIKVFTCGGTVDSDRIEQGKYYFSKTHLFDMIKISNLGKGVLTIKGETIMLKDSRMMTRKDRDLILDHCLQASENNIVIIHGTDTMDLTANVLGESIRLKEKKTIVLTGAMVPFVNPGSDALFNFGYALATVQLSLPGVYVVMNGEIFTQGNFRKHKTKGIFEPRMSE